MLLLTVGPLPERSATIVATSTGGPDMTDPSKLVSAGNQHPKNRRRQKEKACVFWATARSKQQRVCAPRAFGGGQVSQGTGCD